MSDTKANSRQVGGDHYAREFQHWDLMSRLDAPYLVGCLTKYVERHAKKKGGGQVDLEKSVHYAEKFDETETESRLTGGGQRLVRTAEQRILVHGYCVEAGLDRTQTEIFRVSLLYPGEHQRLVVLCRGYLHESYTRQETPKMPSDSGFKMKDRVYVTGQRAVGVIEDVQPVSIFGEMRQSDFMFKVRHQDGQLSLVKAEMLTHAREARATPDPRFAAAKNMGDGGEI